MFQPSQHEAYYLDAVSFVRAIGSNVGNVPSCDNVLIAAAAVYLERTYRIPPSLAQTCALAAVVELSLSPPLAVKPQTA